MTYKFNLNKVLLIIVSILIFLGLTSCSASKTDEIQLESSNDTIVLENSENEEEEKESVTRETVKQIAAVESARELSVLWPHPRTGLIEILEYHGHSNRDSVYAVDKLNFDWKERAILLAEEYLILFPWSRVDLIKQLEFDGYSSEHSLYAVDKLNIDWKEQAVLRIQKIIDKGIDYSKTELIEILMSEYYTYEEAVYGIEESGY